MHILGHPRLRPELACTIAPVQCKLGYRKSVCYNNGYSQIKSLQAIETVLARPVSKTSKHYHMTFVLKSLHWMQVYQAAASINMFVGLSLSLPTTLFKPLSYLIFDCYA